MANTIVSNGVTLPQTFDSTDLSGNSLTDPNATITANFTGNPPPTAAPDPYAQYGGYAGYQQYQATQAQKAQLQTQLNQLDPQQNIGLQNIGNSYNLSANRLDQQNAEAHRNYDTQVAQNGQNYASTRNGINSNMFATNNSLQRLLGLNGSGYSSAAFEQVPYAVALQGSQNLNQAQQTYAKNGSSLDTSWQDTQRSYKNSFDDLNNQRYQQENGLKSSIAQTRANLLSQLQSADGSTAHQGQINDLLSQITNYGNQYASPVIRTADLSFAAPNLGDYTLGQNPNIQNNVGGTSDVSPSFLNVLTQKRDAFGNPTTA